jgi:hypothetical protein
VSEQVISALWWLVGLLGAAVVGLGYLILTERGQSLKQLREEVKQMVGRIIALEEWRKNKKE